MTWAEFFSALLCWPQKVSPLFPLATRKVYANRKYQQPAGALHKTSVWRQIASLVQAAALTWLPFTRALEKLDRCLSTWDNPPWEELSKSACTENSTRFSLVLRKEPEMEVTVCKENPRHGTGSIVSRYFCPRKPTSLTDEVLGWFGPCFSRLCCKSTVGWAEQGWDVRHLWVAMADGFGCGMAWGTSQRFFFSL